MTGGTLTVGETTFNVHDVTFDIDLTPTTTARPIHVDQWRLDWTLESTQAGRDALAAWLDQLRTAHRRTTALATLRNQRRHLSAVAVTAPTGPVFSGRGDRQRPLSVDNFSLSEELRAEDHSTRRLVAAEPRFAAGSSASGDAGRGRGSDQVRRIAAGDGGTGVGCGGSGRRGPGEAGSGPVPVGGGSAGAAAGEACGGRSFGRGA